MLLRTSLPFAALAVAAAFVPAACGSKDPQVPAVNVDAGVAFGASDGGAPMDAPYTLPSATPPASAAPSSPFPPATPSAAPSGSAPNVLAPAIDAAIDVALATQAQKDAPGMQPEGQPGRATLQTGEHFNMIATLQPGRCYTIIAMSAPLQVTQLGVSLFALPLNIEAGRSPATDKNPAVLGKGKGATCPVAPIAVPYKIDVVAKAGAGRMAVQLYSRPK